MPGTWPFSGCLDAVGWRLTAPVQGTHGCSLDSSRAHFLEFSFPHAVFARYRSSGRGCGEDCSAGVALVLCLWGRCRWPSAVSCLSQCMDWLFQLLGALQKFVQLLVITPSHTIRPLAHQKSWNSTKSFISVFKKHHQIVILGILTTVTKVWPF